MCSFDPNNGGRYLDPCMKGIISFLNEHGIETVACCCGHGLYPMSIVVRIPPGVYLEICSGIVMTRRRRYYQKDSKGVYYIPEVLKKVGT